MNKLSPRRIKLSPAAEAADSVASSRNRQEDFGSKGSVGGTAGDGTVGLQEYIGSGFSQSGSSLTGAGELATGELPSENDEANDIATSTPTRRHDITYYEDDSVLLWSDDPEKEYFDYKDCGENNRS